MAQKALKTLAAKNTATLNRTHLISLAINGLYLVLTFLFFSRRFLYYILFNAPALLIEFWFERVARPTFSPDGNELKKAGEDLEAKGLTEWMWDVLYWTWICLVVVTFAGDLAWWLYIIVPLYSGWLAFTTYSGMRSGLGAMASDGGQEATSSGQSKRQAKLEKRGGQRVQYR